MAALVFYFLFFMRVKSCIPVGCLYIRSDECDSQSRERMHSKTFENLDMGMTATDQHEILLERRKWRRMI